MQMIFIFIYDIYKLEAWRKTINKVNGITWSTLWNSHF